MDEEQLVKEVLEQLHRAWTASLTDAELSAAEDDEETVVFGEDYILLAQMNEVLQ